MSQIFVDRNRLAEIGIPFLAGIVLVGEQELFAHHVGESAYEHDTPKI